MKEHCQRVLEISDHELRTTRFKISNLRHSHHQMQELVVELLLSTIEAASVIIHLTLIDRRSIS